MYRSSNMIRSPFYRTRPMRPCINLDRDYDVETFRNALAKCISDGKINIKCSILNDLADVKVLSKDSSSPTLQVFGKLNLDQLVGNTDSRVLQSVFSVLWNPEELAIKIWFQPKTDDKGDQLDARPYLESAIYRQTNQLMFNKRSGNFVNMYATLQCDQSTDLLRKMVEEDGIHVYKTLLDQFEELAEDDALDDFDLDVAIYLILQKIEGNTLRALVNTKVPRDEFIGILFQIVYTCELMARSGIVHNDLHAGNILVETIPKTTLIYFIDESTYVKFTTRYLVRFFDFDLSTSRSVTNPFIDGYMCDSYGVCNIPNDKFDLFTITADLTDNIFVPNRSTFMEFSQWVVPDSDFFNISETREPLPPEKPNEGSTRNKRRKKSAAPPPKSRTKAVFKQKCCYGFTNRLCKPKFLEDPLHGNMYRCDNQYQPPDDIVKTPLEVLQTFPLFNKLKFPIDRYDRKFIPTTKTLDESDPVNINTTLGYPHVYFLTEEPVSRLICNYLFENAT